MKIPVRNMGPPHQADQLGYYMVCRTEQDHHFESSNSVPVREQV